MAVKIKLKRLGKIRAPYYRVIVADSRTRRDGRAIEEIGKYHPTHDPSVIEIDSERVQHWLSVGAQPTEAVTALLKITGDWQKFKGEPGAEGTLKVAEPKPKQGTVSFVAAGLDLSAKKADAKKAAEPKAEEAKAEEPKAEEPKAEEPAAAVEATPADSAEADKPAAAEA